MSDGITTSVDLSRFDRAALRYIEDLGKDAPTVVRNSARLLNAELLRFTPPKTYAQGRAAVKRDIGHAMMLLDAAKIHNEKLAEAIRNEDFDAVEAFINNLRRISKTSLLVRNKLMHFDPSLHQLKRDRRGRVQRPQGIMVIEKREYNRYVREVQGHVGATKYGWAISGRQLGVSIPSWVLGHSEYHGEFHQDLNPTNPTIVMANKGPGIGSLSPNFVQRMVDRRTKAMMRDVDQILAGRASRF